MYFDLGIVFLFKETLNWIQFFRLNEWAIESIYFNYKGSYKNSSGNLMKYVNKLDKDATQFLVLQLTSQYQEISSYIS